MKSLTREEVTSPVARASGWQGVWGVVRHRHFSPFKVFVAREHRTVVVLNPKVGTTSFRHIVGRAYREVLGHRDVSDGRYRLFKKPRHFPFPPLGDYFHAFARPEEYDFYCFVRNPYDRLKSAWLDKLAWGHDEGYPPSIQGAVLHDIRRFARDYELPGMIAGSAIPFSTFVSYVATQATGQRNHHWDEQYSVLLMDRVKYAQIFQMETQFLDGTKQILARVGVPESWTEDALASPRNKSRKIDAHVFTAEIAATVHRCFARDFSHFGYDENSWMGL